MMKNNKGLFAMEEMMKLVLGIVGILLLVYLAASLYGIFTERNKLEQAKAILDNLVEKINVLEESEGAVNYLLESPQEWYLASFEFGKEYAAECDNFCICLCEDVDCEGPRECKPTPKFVLLRNSEGKEQRYLGEKLPLSFNVELYAAEVYPYTEGTSIDYTFFLIQSVTPLFYRFNNGWEWTPDLKNWMPTSTLRVSGGIWDEQYPVKKNQRFIESLDSVGTDKEAGELLFDTKGAKVSEGIIILNAEKLVEDK